MAQLLSSPPLFVRWVWENVQYPVFRAEDSPRFSRVNSAGHFRFLGSWEVRNQVEVHRRPVES